MDENALYEQVLAVGVGGEVYWPASGDLVVDDALFLKAAMILKRSVQVTLKDGGYLIDVPVASHLNRLGVGVVGHDFAAGATLAAAEIVAVSLASEEAEALVSREPRTRPSVLAERVMSA